MFEYFILQSETGLQIIVRKHEMRSRDEFSYHGIHCGLRVVAKLNVRLK